MKLLAVETSGPRGSLAVGDPAAKTVFAQVTWEKKAVHSELITVELAELLNQSNLQIEDLTHISVNAGPGSFTGIRVGLNLARTLAYSLSLPIAATDSLTLLAARPELREKRILIALKAIQIYYYSAGFERGASGLKSVIPAASRDKTELNALAEGFDRILVEGESAGFAFELQAREQIERLAQSPDALSFSSWKEAKPLYIRASEAEEKLRMGLLKPL
jgi:tRNA threonylcarbamoyl adenosine modification protein YeaZ